MNNKLLIVTFILFIGIHSFSFSQNCIEALYGTESFVKVIDQNGDFEIETYYLNGKKHCTERWYVDNKLFIEQEYLNGKKEGELLIYKKGKLGTKGQYINDKAEGIWIYYKTGLRWKYMTRYFEEGEIVETKYYLFGFPLLKLKQKKEINEEATTLNRIGIHKVNEYSYKLDTLINLFKPDSVLSMLQPLFVEQISYNIEGDSLEFAGVVYSNAPVENVSIYEVLDIQDNMFELITFKGKTDAKGQYRLKQQLFNENKLLFIKDGYVINVIYSEKKE